MTRNPSKFISRIKPRLADVLANKVEGRLKREFLYFELRLRRGKNKYVLSLDGSFGVGEFVHPIERDLLDQIYGLFSARSPKKSELRLLVGLRDAELKLELQGLNVDIRGLSTDLTEAWRSDLMIDLKLARGETIEGTKFGFGLSAKASATPEAGVETSISGQMESDKTETDESKRSFSTAGYSFNASSGGPPNSPFWLFKTTLPFETKGPDRRTPRDADQFFVLDGRIDNETLATLQVTDSTPSLRAVMCMSSVRGLHTWAEALDHTAPGTRRKRFELVKQTVIEHLEQALTEGLLFFEWNETDDQGFA